MTHAPNAKSSAQDIDSGAGEWYQQALQADRKGICGADPKGGRRDTDLRGRGAGTMRGGAGTRTWLCSCRTQTSVWKLLAISLQSYKHNKAGPAPPWAFG